MFCKKQFSVKIIFCKNQFSVKILFCKKQFSVKIEQYSVDLFYKCVEPLLYDDKRDKS